MIVFGTSREAKEYLISRIVSEAKREGISLSEVERKMLYFSETDWTLPDILKVNEEFERNYDDNEYEAKIAGLIRDYLQRVQTENEEELDNWTKAVNKLREGDHYLLVMIDSVPQSVGRWSRWLPSLDSTRPRVLGDRLRLLLAALVCIFGMFALMALLNWAFGPDWNHFGR
jgi:hypothetical protein